MPYPMYPSYLKFSPPSFIIPFKKCNLFSHLLFERYIYFSTAHVIIENWQTWNHFCSIKKWKFKPIWFKKWITKSSLVYFLYFFQFHNDFSEASCYLTQDWSIYLLNRRCTFSGICFEEKYDYRGRVAYNMSNTTCASHLYRTLKNNDNNDITFVLVHPKKKCPAARE